MARNSWVQNQGSAELKDGADQFRFLSDQVADFGALAGVKIVPYRDPSLPLFSDQPLVSKYKIIDDLKVFVRICNAVLAAGGQLNDSVALCWSAIKELGLRPASDLFSHISAENVIEVHDPSGIQIFRNFNFYEYCSYSLEELHCWPWSYLYSRNDVALGQLMGLVRKIYDQKIRSTVPTGIGPHIIEELHSQLKYQIFAHQDFISPLFDITKRPVATTIVERGKLHGVPLSLEEEERRALTWTPAAEIG